ncbi:MAG: hypothetical protein JOZ77_08810 [Candidatus Eremiobacteraeota bacterium]|nr:hypothetical protein [Candidatus Eremiobacteraeota bacterium]
MKTFRRSILAAFVLVGASSGAVLAAPLDALDRFAGTWQSEGTFLDTPYSDPGSTSATTVCAWSVDRTFMICQQRVLLNGKPDADVAVYTYDPTQSAYRFYNVRPAQSTSATITIDGNRIVYPFSFTDHGKNVTIRTLNVWENANTYKWRTEYSTDGGAHWTLMASGISRKS